jgi:hypothetical protein
VRCPEAFRPGLVAAALRDAEVKKSHLKWTNKLAGCKRDFGLEGGRFLRRFGATGQRKRNPSGSDSARQSEASRQSRQSRLGGVAGEGHDAQQIARSATRRRRNARPVRGLARQTGRRQREAIPVSVRRADFKQRACGSSAGCGSRQTGSVRLGGCGRYRRQIKTQPKRGALPLPLRRKRASSVQRCARKMCTAMCTTQAEMLCVRSAGPNGSRSTVIGGAQAPANSAVEQFR